jgi:hypothetical protein
MNIVLFIFKSVRESMECLFAYIFSREEEEESGQESILLEVIVHIHYTSYTLLFLLHNQYHRIKVSRGDTSLAKERMM